MRERVINIREKRLFITNFNETIQKEDLTVPPNCNGLGRIRHFYKMLNPQWFPDPLPIEPARKALGFDNEEFIRAQVFQLGACNWRCWYCYVDYSLLSANRKQGAWLSTDELVELYINEPDPPKLIDLTGGSPTLVPEWVPWMMKSLIKAGVDVSTYLWSDDNLSTDYLWRFLSDEDLELMSGYPNYGRVGCFKGFDKDSFSFNTSAEPALFEQQFLFMERLLSLGLKMYGYATFTTQNGKDIRDKMAKFVDRLQQINPYFPLRVIPLEIKMYKSNNKRFVNVDPDAISNQYRAIDAWRKEINSRFTSEELKMNIVEIPTVNKC